MEGVAYAEPVGADAVESPITAEAEAEKPTRVRKGAAEPAKKPARKKKPVEPEEPEEEPVAAEEVAEEAPPKKKTRRGSRGGRNRKKKTAVSAISANGDEREPAAAEEETAPVAPVIHLPGRELEGEPSENGDQPAVPKKRPTRRGSRGGRNRKKKTATPARAEAEAEPAPAEESGRPSEWEYTPMSEWGHE